MTQVSEIIKLISELKTIQLIDLITELERLFKFHVTPQTPASPVVNDGELVITLTSVGPNKINVIKEIRAVLGLGLKESKEFVENIPQVIKDKLTQSEAMKLKLKLENVGASVSVS
ncbi:MAG: ribosomal protein bL12 [Candidatus Hodgkinia cicadicola]